MVPGEFYQNISFQKVRVERGKPFLLRVPKGFDVKKLAGVQLERGGKVTVEKSDDVSSYVAVDKTSDIVGRDALENVIPVKRTNDVFESDVKLTAYFEVQRSFNL